MNRPKTIFLDIDGTLIEHSNNISKQFTKTPKLLEGTLVPHTYNLLEGK